MSLRPRLLRLAPVVSVLALAACGERATPAANAPREAAPAAVAGPATPIRAGALRLPARVAGTEIQPALAGAFRSRFWTGVNLGSAVPGKQPGEVPGTRRDFDRWLAGMGELGANVVRVYTILPPAFYDALAAYNEAHRSRPLYVIQGVWIPEDEFMRTKDAYHPEVTHGFRREIADAVAVVHGDATLRRRRGHAGGRYRSNIAPWLLAWSLGIEWDPDASSATNRKHAGRPAFAGRYIASAPGSTAMESWLASMLDHAATLEAARGWSRPLTFTNWPTADPLRHPDEPAAFNDAVTIDAANVRATRRWPGGFFASYHIYPYYPDFLALEREYGEYRRPRDGREDAYSGYLHALRRHHRGQALMVTEFGLPTGIGIAHRGPHGRDQGGHGERQAGEKVAEMLADLREEGYAGGVVFSYVDEWHKLTWNTMDLERSGDRRQLWRNVLTNEEHFGLVAAEPGAAPAVVLDGDDREWAANGSQVIQESRGAIREVRAVKDEAFLYLRLRFDAEEPWRSAPVTLALDVRPGGNRGVPGHPGAAPDADLAVTIGPGADARMVQATWTDPVAILYGAKLGYLDVDPRDLRPGSGAWVAPRLMLNRPRKDRRTGRRLAAEVADIGRLGWGPGDPRRPDSDVRNLVMGRGRVVELRLPWAMLTFSDPSDNRVYVQHPNGTVTTQYAGRVGLSLVGADGSVVPTRGYAWERWNRVTWHERRKGSWEPVRRAFAAAARR